MKQEIGYMVEKKKSIIDMTCKDCKHMTHANLCELRGFQEVNRNSRCSCVEEGKHESRQHETESETTEVELKLGSVVSARHFLDNGAPQIEWYVRDIIPKGGITFFGGTSGGFKSWNALQLSIALATGTHYMNEFSTEKSTVLYIDEENGFVTIPNRLEKLVKGHQLIEEPFDNLHFSIFNNVYMDSKDQKTFLMELMGHFKPNVVIIDSMVRCMMGEEDKAKDVKEVFSNIKPYIENGTSFVILHHTAKREIDTMAGLRGSGDFAAFADVVLMFKPSKEGYFNINIVKNRHIEIDDTCNFFGKLDSIDDEKATIEYKGVHDEKGSVAERCASDIERWITAEKLDSFDSQRVMKFGQNNGYSKNSVFSGLKLLVNQHKLIKLKRGKYKVDKENLLTVEEEVI